MDHYTWAEHIDLDDDDYDLAVEAIRDYCMQHGWDEACAIADTATTLGTANGLIAAYLRWRDDGVPLEWSASFDGDHP